MSSLSNSRRLRNYVERVMPELSGATAAVLTHPQLRDLYPEFMIVVHQMVRATVPLMRAALARCRELADRDPVAAAMVAYFEQHIKEEMHHDEWILDDLESIGVPRSFVLRRMPTSALASYIGGLYYWIFHHHPVAKLGQIAVVEGYPPAVETIDRLVEKTGYPRSAFHTLEKHCHLDVNHRNDFDEAVDQLPLGDEHFAILEVSVLHTVRTAAKAYREIVDRAVMPLRRSDLAVSKVADNGHYRVEDTDFGRTYAIGEEECFLFEHCDGQANPNAVCSAFSERFGQALSRLELTEFVDAARSEHWLAERQESP